MLLISLTAFKVFFFCLVPVGIAVLIKTIRMLKGMFNGAVLAEIPFLTKELNFTITRPGVYAIWQKGKLFQRTPIDKFNLQLTGESGVKVPLTISFFNPYVNGLDTARMEICRFTADKGNYTMNIVEGSAASLFEKLFARLFPANNLDYSTYYLQVRESLPVYYILIAIPLFTLSAFCIIGGVVGGFLAQEVVASFVHP